MSKTESLEDFYRKKFDQVPNNLQRESGHFNVFKVEDCIATPSQPVTYARRDFYKFSLNRGEVIYHYADKSIHISGTTLMFFNPRVPYTVEFLSELKSGYFCIFKEAFFTENVRGGIRDLPMFSPGGKPSFALNEQQDQHVSLIFEKMLEEVHSDYRFKNDLIRNYVTEMLHYALKIGPTETLHQHTDANSRITAVFNELLDRQFPIESPAQRLSMRSAKDFADQLSVHVNHLNRAVKETTGKTTTGHIAERIISEAKALLKHTNWNISEISYCLGFEEPSHFNNFFRKQAALTPTAFRLV
ncbi:helix-turn-helix domain-containing protein [Pedobacter nutrimenti]|jgi:AraC-like DNA-binding protein|uniref:AraC-like DNA-binding protein n=1 Tax=Pedobacter nutrimenti TaxID=1241337 RepID=A0A318UC15_9SPHI|nr:AraC family transcriptional regulator [Pedobacter nutrimenti]PYF71492.1 AraC-like DNA-binding protein [Pedobacter nutrimenti]|eukprot:gene17559-20953_t